VNVDAERLFFEGLPHVEHVLKWLGRRLGNAVSYEDMRAYAHTALLEAARTYDPSRASLTTYVSRKVRWAILDNLKRERRSRRAVARASALLASERLLGEGAFGAEDGGSSGDEHEERLDGLLEVHAAALAIGLVTGGPTLEGGGDTPEDRTARAELSHRIRAALATLPERERALVERHYFGGEDFDDIAADLGISKSWASRLHGQALATLGPALSGRRGRSGISVWL
jgi:RNA polymerase sigma factor FliA